MKNSNWKLALIVIAGIIAVAMLCVFWIFWIILTGGACYGFCYLDNHWLE